jgi:Pyridoxamine 5'-phosphate oxidase
MELTDTHRDFLREHHSAAMVTRKPNGMLHVVRVGVALVDGKVWSSGTQDRARTKHVRRDPFSSLFLFDARWRWLTLKRQ